MGFENGSLKNDEDCSDEEDGGGDDFCCATGLGRGFEVGTVLVFDGDDDGIVGDFCNGGFFVAALLGTDGDEGGFDFDTATGLGEGFNFDVVTGGEDIVDFGASVTFGLEAITGGDDDFVVVCGFATGADFGTKASATEREIPLMDVVPSGEVFL